MTEAEQISTVKLFRLHIDNGDLPGASRYLDPAFSIDEPDSPTPQTTQGFVATLERIMDIWEHLGRSRRQYEFASVSNKVFVETRFTGRNIVNGRVAEIGFVEVFEFKDDKILHVRPYYWDPALIMETRNTTLRFTDGSS